MGAGQISDDRADSFEIGKTGGQRGTDRRDSMTCPGAEVDEREAKRPMMTKNS